MLRIGELFGEPFLVFAMGVELSAAAAD